MSIEEKIEGYAFSMLLIQLAFVFIGLTDVYPYSLEVAGLDVYDDITDTANTIQTMYNNIAGNGLVGSAIVTGFMLIMGIKIVLEFVILTLTGAYPIMTALGLPAIFALPMSLFLGAVTVYGIAIKFMGR